MSSLGSGFFFWYGQAVSASSRPLHCIPLLLLLWIILPSLATGDVSPRISTAYHSDSSSSPLATAAARMIKLRSEETKETKEKPKYIRPEDIKKTDIIEVDRLNIPKTKYSQYQKMKVPSCFGCTYDFITTYFQLIIGAVIIGIVGYVIPIFARRTQTLETIRTNYWYQKVYHDFLEDFFNLITPIEWFNKLWKKKDEWWHGTTEQPGDDSGGLQIKTQYRNYTGPSRFYHANLRFLEKHWLGVLLVFALSIILACAFVWKYMQSTNKAIRDKKKTRTRKRGRRRARR